MNRVFVSVAVIAGLCGAAFGQSPTPVKFEIADVHASPPSSLAAISGGVPRNGRYEVRNATMLDLVRTAYSIEAEKVAGGPNWLSTDRFDVIAKASTNVNQETARLMLRQLLAERFGLTVHNDTRPLPVYVLSAGKGKHKLKPSDGSESGCRPKPQGAPQPGVIPYQEVSCHNLTSAQIAENLRQLAPAYLDKIVIDELKLEGTWDFDLKWTGRGQLAAAGADGISAFDAVDKQLGLKVELQPVPTPVIVVDNVNRTPTPNAPGVAEALPPEKPEFETAEIKPIPPDGPQGVGIRYTPGGRIDATGTLRQLIGMAFEVLPNTSADMLVSGLKFIDTARYSIVAKAPSTGIGAASRDGGREVAPPIDVALKMLRALLEDRFKLKTHREMRPTTSYAITVKGDLKLKKAESSDRSNCRPDPGAAPPNPSGAPLQVGTCTNTTMEQLANILPQVANGYVDHPIVDMSGLQGGWNFTFYWSPRQALDTRPEAGGAATDPGAISLWEGLEKLGLKAEKGTHPVSVIVIDSMEEKPVD